MVEGVEALRRRLGRVTKEIERQLRPELEKAARQIVAQMNAVKPLPNIQIAWVWGKPPAGTLSLGSVAASKGDREFISIYATATSSEYPGGFPALARWFEFGTAQRYQANGKSVGAITAQPYFFPVYRANRGKVVSAIRRKVRQAVKSL